MAITSHFSIALMIALVACGDDPERLDIRIEIDAADTTDTSEPETIADTAEPDIAPATPRVRFMIDERPHDDTNAEVAATTARWGDPIRVVVDGLPPGATLALAFTAAAGMSEARFIADEAGVVDLGRDTPLPDSDWQVAHADGFMWSMRDPFGPFDPKVQVWAYVDGDEVAYGELARHTLNGDVTTEAVADGTIRGLFAYPPGEGPFGGAVCFGGSEGGTNTGERCAMYLASLGYAALGVGYFGAEGLPATLSEVPLEILEGDLAWLTANARVAPGGVVVIGGSRGGELALMLGARFAVINGVVAQVPSGYVWPATTGESAAWTWAGEPIPFVPSSDEFARPAISSEGIRGYASTNIFTSSIEGSSPEALLAATIEVERTDGPVYFLGGVDDQLWPSCPMAEVAWLRLVAAGHDRAHGDRYLCNADAGHISVGTPGWTSVGTTALPFAEFDLMLVMGGTIAGNGMAVRANDTATRELLEAVLGPGKIVAPSSR